MLQNIDMHSALDRDGFILLRELDSHVSTLKLARQIGSVLEIEKLLPASGIPTVQTLRPRDTIEARRNQYSGNYGLDRFPLHTDLAHWVLPPRYFVLRCVVGTADVYTTIFPSAQIVDLVGRPALGKAVFKGRRRGFGCSGLVRALSSHQHEEVFRWDPVFLEPLSKYAHALKHVMDDPVTFESQTSVKLAKPGDTSLWTTGGRFTGEALLHYVNTGSDSLRAVIYQPLYQEAGKMETAIHANNMQTNYSSDVFQSLSQNGNLGRIPKSLRQKIVRLYEAEAQARSHIFPVAHKISVMIPEDVKKIRSEADDKA